MGRQLFQNRKVRVAHGVRKLRAPVGYTSRACVSGNCLHKCESAYRTEVLPQDRRGQVQGEFLTGGVLCDLSINIRFSCRCAQ